MLPCVRSLPHRPNRRGRFLLGALWVWALIELQSLAQPDALVLPGLEVGVEGIDPGEVLLGELNCVACHAANAAIRTRLNPKTAPLLGDLAVRAQPRFIESFIAAPHREKPGTLMPDLLHGLEDAERQTTAEALAHFLFSLTRSTAPNPPSRNRLLLEQGRVLYHRTGCVACHAPEEAPAIVFPEFASSGPSDPDASRFVLAKLGQDSVPLGDLRGKYSPTGLVRFLIDPLAARPAGRMPSLSLTEGEAQAITAYLQRDPGGATIPGATAKPAAGASAPSIVDAAKVKRGRDLFASLGCAACHELGEAYPRVASRLVAPPLDGVEPQSATGCLSSQPGRGTPRYLMSEAQSLALRSTLARRAELAKPLPPRHRVLHLMAAFNCYACHSRDGYGGPSPSRADYFVVVSGADLGDEGRIPPHLTEVGNKLRPEWLHTVLTNRGLVRPYMATRMPQFGVANVQELARALLTVDLPAGAPAAAGPEGLDPDAGRLLTGTSGYACISCHTFGPHKSLGISVMDMTQIAKRLRHDWFYRYLLDPASLRPGTRMPAFWPGGKPTLPDPLEGDTTRQINAIWAYLSQGTAAKPPPGLVDLEPVESAPRRNP